MSKTITTAHLTAPQLFLKVFLGFLVGLILAVNSTQVNAQQQRAQEMGLTDYEYFIVYPHLDKGFSALEQGDQSKAIEQFQRALKIVPGNIPLILHVVEAYRHFNDDESARRFLEQQITANPNAEILVRYLESMQPQWSVIDSLEALQAANKQCAAQPSPECRARVSYAALQLEQLPLVVEQLEDKVFQTSIVGQEVEYALLQRALFLGEWPVADNIFSRRWSQQGLSSAEYEQWFHTLLVGRLDERLAELQQQNLFNTPEDHINYAGYLLAQNRQKELSDYLSHHQPVFQSPEQERRWLFLIISTDAQSEALLNQYQAYYPDNKAFIASSLLPHALAAKGTSYLDKVLADLPADQYLQERYDLSLARDDRQAAKALAWQIYEQAGASLSALDVYTWRLQSLGAETEALAVLLRHYPFVGPSDSVADLTMRLFALARKYAHTLSAEQKQRLLQPLDQPALREQQTQLPWAQGDCAAITKLLGDYRSAYSAYAWALLGACYRENMQGLAVHAFEQAAAIEPSIDRIKALAYQLFEVQDYHTALLAWKNVPIEQMSNDDLQAATLTAELAGNTDWQGQLLQEQSQRRLDSTLAYWLSKAKYYLDKDTDTALRSLDHAIAIEPTGLALSLRADIYRQRQELDNAHQDLLHALELEPDNRLYAAALGYLLWDKEQLSQAKEIQEYALQAMPNDLGLVRQLSFISERLDQPDDAQKYIKQVVDDIDYQAEIKPLAPELKQERFNFRRMHEDVARKWTVNFDTSIGLRSNSNYLTTPQEGIGEWSDTHYSGFAQLEAEYRLGKNKIVQDDQLSVYGRIITSTEHSSSILPTKVPVLGVGLRWKPWRERVVFAALERLIPLDHRGRADTLVRLSGSFFNDGQYSDDWHPNGPGWWAQNLYLDGAHYINDNRQAWVADYRVSWHQKINEGQTLEPYAHIQTQGHRENSATRAFHGMGVGVRWNTWFGQTRYDAWPHKLSVGIEVQQIFKTVHADTRKRNNILLTLGLRW